MLGKILGVCVCFSFPVASRAFATSFLRRTIPYLHCRYLCSGQPPPPPSRQSLPFSFTLPPSFFFPNRSCFVNARPDSVEIHLKTLPCNSRLPWLAFKLKLRPLFKRPGLLWDPPREWAFASLNRPGFLPEGMGPLHYILGLLSCDLGFFP